MAMANDNGFYSTGRRKESKARVWIKPGSGAMTVKPSTWPGVPTGLTFQKATKGLKS